MSGANGHATTGNGQDPFDDIEDLRMPDEEAANRLEAARKANAARQPSRRIPREFAKVPIDWAEKLDPVTLKVFIFILHRNFRHMGSPFAVTTTGLGAWGISRWQKTQAINELVKLGLIRLEPRESRKNPVVKKIDV